MAVRTQASIRNCRIKYEIKIIGRWVIDNGATGRMREVREWSYVAVIAGRRGRERLQSRRIIEGNLSNISCLTFLKSRNGFASGSIEVFGLGRCFHVERVGDIEKGH